MPFKWHDLSEKRARKRKAAPTHTADTTVAAATPVGTSSMPDSSRGTGASAGSSSNTPLAPSTTVPAATLAGTSSIPDSNRGTCASACTLSTDPLSLSTTSSSVSEWARMISVLPPPVAIPLESAEPLPQSAPLSAVSPAVRSPSVRQLWRSVQSPQTSAHSPRVGSTHASHVDVAMPDAGAAEATESAGSVAEGVIPEASLLTLIARPGSMHPSIMEILEAQGMKIVSWSREHFGHVARLQSSKLEGHPCVLDSGHSHLPEHVSQFARELSLRCHPRDRYKFGSESEYLSALSVSCRLGLSAPFNQHGKATDAGVMAQASSTTLPQGDFCVYGCCTCRN